MHRRKDLWGPDGAFVISSAPGIFALNLLIHAADHFDPDRFIDERLHKYLIPNPYVLLPFNAGPRICMGQQFAYNEISFMLIRLLQSFDGVTLALDELPPASRPPVDWLKAGDRKRMEKIRPKSHLTLYAEVGQFTFLTRLHAEFRATGGFMGCE